MQTILHDFAPWTLLALQGCAVAPTFSDWEAADTRQDAGQFPSAVEASDAQQRGEDFAFGIDPWALADATIPEAGPAFPALDAGAPDVASQAPNGAQVGGSGASLDAAIAARESGVDGAAADARLPNAASDASMCVPALCNNRCALLRRCCNADNVCACEDLVTRQCTLESL